MIWGYPYFRKHPYMYENSFVQRSFLICNFSEDLQNTKVKITILVCWDILVERRADVWSLGVLAISLRKKTQMSGKWISSWFKQCNISTCYTYVLFINVFSIIQVYILKWYLKKYFWNIFCWESELGDLRKAFLLPGIKWCTRVVLQSVCNKQQLNSAWSLVKM